MKPGNPPKKKPNRKEKVEASSGNIFADLNLPYPDELLAKAELVRYLCGILSEKKLGQTEAASLLGVDEPQISALFRGRLDDFSTDQLFRFLNALDQEVEIRIRPRGKQENQGIIRTLLCITWRN